MRLLSIIYHRILALIAKTLPQRRFVSLVADIIKAYSRTHPAEDALRTALELDNKLYSHIGQLAIRYGDGVHTKHRHIRYHDFFVTRISPGESVLDVGCGMGAVAYDLAERAGAMVTGIDLNPDAIEMARKRFAHPNVRYRLADIEKDLQNEHFDVVVMSNVLEHLKDRVNVLKSLIEKATPSRILIRVPLYERDWRVPLKDELDVDYRLDPTHEVEYTVDSFVSELSEAGLHLNDMVVKWGEIWAEATPAQK